MFRCNSALLAAASLAFAGPAAAQVDVALPAEADARPALALMGTIPIYWGEAAGLEELLSGAGSPHWARAVIEGTARPVPLDYLSAEALAPFDMLLMAQPRGLSGEENVALDAWVREGGRLLLFADPAMTGGSRFGIGDRRRPQDTVLLSPILAHWGLRLNAPEGGIAAHHDHGADHGDPSDRSVTFGQATLPLDEEGAFTLLGEDGASDCALALDGVLARCAIGAGHVLLLADAAILDLAGPREGAEAGFRALLADAFPEFGENAGNASEMAAKMGDSL